MKTTTILFFIILHFYFQNCLLTSVAKAQSPQRAVLIEEFTGEWCGWCPIGMMELENMKEKYGDTLIVVAVHFGDQLEPASASGMIGAWGSTAPSALINREYDSIIDTQVFSPEDWDEVIARQIIEPAPCNVHLIHSYNETTREIIATVTASFTEDYIGDGRINLYIVEDSVIGVSQSNYLSGNPDFINTPFYSLPEHIEGFVHQHVLREMVGESYGIDEIIPDTVTAGQQFQYTFNYTIPSDYKLEHLHLIGVAQQYKGLKKYRKILNSVHDKFDINGSINEYKQNSNISISPNPADDFVRIKIKNNEMIKGVKVFTMDGSQLIYSRTQNREMLIETHNFTNGCFILVVETDSNTYYNKLIINK